MGFERLECIHNPNSGLKFNKCYARLIGRQFIRIDMVAALNHTLESAFLHYSVFYQFSTNEFRSFPVNGWEDFCGYMRGDAGNIFIKTIYPPFRKFTNLNDSCPIKRPFILFKIQNLTMSYFSPLFMIPSGRYRLDLAFHEGFNG